MLDMLRRGGGGSGERGGAEGGIRVELGFAVCLQGYDQVGPSSLPFGLD